MNGAAKLTCVATLIWVSACGGTTSPVAPSSSPSSNATTFGGYVFNGIVGAIGGALVTVTDGPSAGTTAVTDANGYFRLTFAYSSTGQIQVTKVGYAATTAPAALRPNGFIAIMLHSATPPAILNSAYTVTFAADAACTQLPEIARTRSYTANVQQASQFPQNTSFDVMLSGASFGVAQDRTFGALNSFFGYVEANAIDFRIVNRYDLADVAEGIAEEVAPHVLLEIQGEAKVTVTDTSTIAAPMNGSISVTDAAGTRTCTSANHVLTFRRRS